MSNGEYLKMIDDAAERAANRVADRMTTEIDLRLMKNNQELRTELGDIIEQKFIAYFGMTPQEHLVQHAAMKSLLDSFSNVWRYVGQKLGLALLVMAVTFMGVTAADFWSGKAQPALMRDERMDSDRGEPETPNASNP